MAMTLSGDGTITGLVAGGLPDATITQPEMATGVAGTGPAFSAYANTNQSMTANTTTKILFQVEEFDTNNNFASSTFTPTVAGYYQVSGRVRVGSSTTNLEIYIYKNGAPYKTGSSVDTNSVGGLVTTLVYCNGSTDYIEVYARFSNTQNTLGTQSETWFNGAMIRSA